MFFLLGEFLAGIETRHYYLALFNSDDIAKILKRYSSPGES